MPSLYQTLNYVLRKQKWKHIVLTTKDWTVSVENQRYRWKKIIQCTYGMLILIVVDGSCPSLDHILHLLPSPSSPCSLHYRLTNPSVEILRQGTQLWRASWPRRWQTNGLKLPSCRGPDARFLQMSPRTASLRQGDVWVSFPYSHFTRGMKWNICYYINKQRCHSYLQFQLSKCELLSHSSKQQMGGAISHTKNSGKSQSFTGSGCLPVNQAKAS